MSCRELEALFLADAAPAAVAAHRSRCAACDALGAELDLAARLTEGLRTPAWSRELRRALEATPSITMTCERADEAIAAAVDAPLAAEDRRRLDFHLSRCRVCAETAETLATMRHLVAPSAAPWLPVRLAASRPVRPAVARRRWLFGPKGAIALAYAAAVLVMLLGFNPADLARSRAATRLRQETRVAAEAAGSSVVDRLGALEERAARAVVAARGRFGAYGRAALVTALNLVMKSENPRPSDRPRSGDDKGASPRSQTEISTWRA